MDDLAQLTQKGIISRRKAAERATHIIDEESHKCWRHLVGEKKNNQIGDVYRKMDEIREREIEPFYHTTRIYIKSKPRNTISN